MSRGRAPALRPWTLRVGCSVAESYMLTSRFNSRSSSTCHLTLSTPSFYYPAMMKHIARYSLALAIVLAGCATSSKLQENGACVDSAPRQSVRQRKRGGDRQARQDPHIKSGATPATSITVDVPADMPKAMFAGVARDLATSGFTHIVFRRPEEKTVTVADKSSPDQPATSTPATTAPVKVRGPASQKPVRSGTL